MFMPLWSCPTMFICCLLPFTMRTAIRIAWWRFCRASKGASAHSVNRMLQRSGPVWQEESFDHVLRSNESFEENLEYIRQNPVRRGLVIRPEDYRWLWVEQG
jgi:hypothetical protein